jgi:hypothetical protein
LRGAFQPKQSFNFQGIASLRNARNDTIKINLNEYKITASVQGWVNHVRYGNTVGLRKAMLGRRLIKRQN